jgi:hypothetical protein
MHMPALTLEFGEEPLFRLRGDHGRCSDQMQQLSSPSLFANSTMPIKFLDTPILQWDDVCISDSDDDDDNDDVADLDELVLDDDEVVTDDEETNCQGSSFSRAYTTISSPKYPNTTDCYIDFILQGRNSLWKKRD